MVIERCNLHALIDRTDVAVTILSQVGYEALIRERPVVMLGYNQLRGKGCTYESFTRESLEKTLLCALESGLTGQMRREFTKHVARALSTFLYDDQNDNHDHYGRPLEQLDEALDEQSPFRVGMVRYKTQRKAAFRLRTMRYAISKENLKRGIVGRALRKLVRMVRTPGQSKR